MFKIDPNPQFTHTVKIRVPVDGGFREDTLKATFRVIPTDEAKTFDLSEGSGSRDFLCRAIVNLDDIADAEGNPLPYNDALRDQLLNFQYVRVGLGRAYFEGVAGARTGN